MRVRIWKGSYERFLNLCANHRIRLWEVCPMASGYEASMSVRDFFQLRPLARKCHTRIRVRKKCGLPFFVHRHRKRKVFALGLLFCGFFIFFLSCFVWKITIEGNVSISRQTMMEYLSSRRIGYGTSKRAVDCRQLAADLRNDFPQITWVSVRLQGTYLSVLIRENDGPDAKEEETAPGASDLVADADGTIVHMITREGLPVVGEGSAVRAGDVLVRGAMEITDDEGNVTGYRYCAADADVRLRTEIPYEDRFSRAHETLSYTGRKRCGVYLKLFGKCFGINPGLDRFEHSDLLAGERQLCILEDFYLPFSACLVTAREYRTCVEMYTEEEARALAEAKLQKFLSENEEKGVQIFENNVKIEISATSCHASGTLTVEKSAGKSVRISKTDLPQEDTGPQEGTDT